MIVAWVAIWIWTVSLAFVAGYNWPKASLPKPGAWQPKPEDQPPVPTEASPEIKSALLDPDDPLQQAKWAHDEMVRKMNKPGGPDAQE